jgi:hypothetical protein
MPVYIVWIVGIAVSILVRKKHPQASPLATISLSLFLATSILYRYISLQLPFIIEGMDIHLGFAFTLIAVINALMDSVLWALLIVAIFIGRKTENT